MKLLLLLLPFMLGATPAPEKIPENGPVPGDVPAPPTPSVAVLLAQMCVSEISWQKDTRECALMIEINYRNAKRNGLSVVKQTKRFNSYFKHPNKRRPWIQYLNAEGSEPSLWPRKAAAWKVHKKLWNAYLQVAKDYPKKSRRRWYKPICERADDYGGRCDDNGLHACDTPKQKCARKISCLHNVTNQAYWNLECCRNRKKCKDNYKS